LTDRPALLYQVDATGRRQDYAMCDLRDRRGPRQGSSRACRSSCLGHLELRVQSAAIGRAVSRSPKGRDWSPA
jgi:hypothetical protein